MVCVTICSNISLIPCTCDYYTSSHILIHYAILNNTLTVYYTYLYIIHYTLCYRREGGYRQDPGHIGEGQPIRVKGHRLAERQRER